MPKKMHGVLQIYIYINWLKGIFYNYQLFIAKNKCYLIMDKAPSYIDKKIF